MRDQKELSQKYSEIKENIRSKVVGFLDQQYSERPIASWGYKNCAGVILLGVPKEPDFEDFEGRNGRITIPRNAVVVTHYGNTEDQPPMTDERIFAYLNCALSHFRACDLSELVAGVLAGDERHFDLIMGFLERNHVNVKGTYCDRSSDDPNIEYGRQHKDLVVSPQLEKAIVSIEHREYVELL
jgi:hypothetical protein